MEDALLSPESFSILSGAGLIDAAVDAPIYVHTTSQIEVEEDNTIELPEAACWNKYGTDDTYYHRAADIFIMTMENGEIAAEPCIPANVTDHKVITCYGHSGKIEAGSIVLVDYYVKRTGGAQTIEITPDKFGGNYYLEADTLFRRESDGVDMPAEFIIPNCKVQSNFTFSMASTGDPSTFTFTMDAFPDYTKFDQTHKVLAAIQVISDVDAGTEDTRKPCAPFEVLDYETGVIGDYGQKPVKDLYMNNVVATPDDKEIGLYHITGDFKPIDEWSGLPTSSWQDNAPFENAAFYVVAIPETYRGHQIEIKSGGQGTNGLIGDDELLWVFNVTKKPTIEINIDGKLFAKLDFSKINILADEG